LIFPLLNPTLKNHIKEKYFSTFSFTLQQQFVAAQQQFVTVQQQFVTAQQQHNMVNQGRQQLAQRLEIPKVKF